MPSPPPTIHFSFPLFPLQLLLVFSFFIHSPTAISSENQFEFDGGVLELDDSNFDAAVSNLITFSSIFMLPGAATAIVSRLSCCSRQLIFCLEKAAYVLAGFKQPIAVAKVDADKYKKLASKHDINGYPTLKIFTHGVPTEYYGPRKADLLVRFLTKFVAPDVAVLCSDSAVKDFIVGAGFDFPIFVGFGLNESMILNLAVKYKMKAWFSVAKDFSDEFMTVYDFDKVPALVAIHPAYNQHSTFYGPFEEKFLDDYINQSLLPLILPINQYSLKSLKDDQRKVLLTIVEDETAEKSQGLLKVLKAAASANPDLIIGYVGFRQWKYFAESFEVDKKTQLPKMVVWDGNVEYYLVIGIESIDDTDTSAQVSRFLEGYREGSVIRKRMTVPTLIGFINSQLGVIIVFLLIFVLLLVGLIISITKDESPTRELVTEGRTPTLQPETRELRGAVKED